MKSTITRGLYTLTIAAVLLSSPAFAQNAASSTPEMSTTNDAVPLSLREANKKLAVDFYEMALNQKNPDLAMNYVSRAFKQHSVLVEDGYTGLKKFLDWVRTDQPKLHADIIRAFADGNFVILDVHMIRHPGDRGLAIAEIYRVQDGKLAEHWDRIQEIPEKSKNTNGMW